MNVKQSKKLFVICTNNKISIYCESKNIKKKSLGHYLYQGTFINF